MVFEWDNKKNKANALKHGISFEQAVFIFDSEYQSFSSRMTGGEIGECLIGQVENFGITFVVVTRRGDRIRFISARRASKKEREFYYVNQDRFA